MSENMPSDIKNNAPSLTHIFSAQRVAFSENTYPNYKARQADLRKLHNLIVDHSQALIEAVNQDFGTRAGAETKMSEILAGVESIAYYQRRLRRFMLPQRRHAPLILQPMQASVRYQPLGVVGIIVPWNFPILLSIPPLAAALAAGNRIMIKLSEFTPHTGALLAKLITENFPADQIAIILGEAEVAREFSALPFDHLLFTGSTQVGRSVMRAAAENLTPVTLELGGKSPALIHRDFPIDIAAQRLAFGKTFSAGQACIAPDYILCPEDKVTPLITALRQEISLAYPSMLANPEYTSLISARQKARLTNYLHDAEAKGATLIEINPAGENFSDTNKMPVTILTDVTDEMQIMQDEIFGPLLPIVPYQDLDQAIAYINARPRALSIYYFDWSRPRADHIMNQTHSGSFGWNDTLTQIAIDDLPFGGIGPSGMGHYHGVEGFRTFSHAKATIAKGRFDSRRPFFRSPRKNRFFEIFDRLVNFKLRRKGQ